MIILCADDYAMTEGISRAVGELAAAKRLSATSVMVNLAHWPAAAPRLRAHRGHLSIGLHLNLTLGPPLGPMPRLAPAGRLPGAGSLVARALCGLLDGEEVRGEIERQLDRFETGLQFPPDHIDGHQHVHVLPKVRTALLRAARRRYPTRPQRPAAPSPSGAWRCRPCVAALTLGCGRGEDAATRQQLSVGLELDERTSYAHELESAAAAGVAASRHVASGHPDERSPASTRRRASGDGVRGDHARSGPRRASGGPRARRRAAIDSRRWRLKGEQGRQSAPGAQRPVRHAMAFFVSGGTAFLVDALVLTLLTAVAGLHPILARVAAIALAMVAGWLMHRTFTFRVRARPSLPEFLRYAGVAWSAAAVNYGVFVLIVLAYAAIEPLVALIVSSAVAMAFAYVGMRLRPFDSAASDAPLIEGGQTNRITRLPILIASVMWPSPDRSRHFEA
jgi:predicted glycoside hydrolase/deacetylase ChbG (UPF0249 family)/putative flippase GtrA